MRGLDEYENGEIPEVDAVIDDQQLREKLALQLAAQRGMASAEAIRRHEQLQLKYALILDMSKSSDANRRDSVSKLDVTLLYPAQALKQNLACADPLSPEGTLGSRFGLSCRTIDLRSNQAQIVAVKVNMLLPVHGFHSLITQFRDTRGQLLKKSNTFKS